MMRQVVCYIVMIAAMLMGNIAQAQEVADSTAQRVADTTAVAPTASRRFITPVKQSTNKVLLPGKNIDDKQLELYLTGDTAQALKDAALDSIKRAYTRYPRLTDMAVGLNFLDLVMCAAGQDYINLDASLTLNMWNRVQPVVELGVGWGKYVPEDESYTYKARISPFARIGANYNLTFKHSPHYQALLGLRLGGSIFKYEVNDIKHHNGYWDEAVTASIPSQTCRALWWEAVAGLKVKIWRQLSLGWMVRYHNILSENQHPHGAPWLIPGYGKRNGSIALSFNAYYTLPFTEKKQHNTQDIN